mgnify:CR=1 FL=1|jgi:predicted DNA-binding protein YlxM (UPF0122 family)
MDSKTIKQISDELCVSKQAVWQRIKRNSKLSTMLSEHSNIVNGAVVVDKKFEQLIKKIYSTHSTIDDQTVNTEEQITTENKVLSLLETQISILKGQLATLK